MIKMIGCTIAAILVALSLFTLTGCGEREQARDYMIEADEVYESAQSVNRELVETLGGVDTILLTSDTAKIQEYVAKVDETEKSFEDYRGLLDAAADKYEKLDTVQGVEDYITYKNMMLKVIEADLDALEAGKELFDRVEPIFEQIAAGQQVDITTEASEILKSTRKFNEKVEKAESRRNKTRAFQKSFDLGKK